MIDYCPCDDDKPDSCPVCGATISGNDKHHGICQARSLYRPREPILYLCLKDKLANKIVASVPVL